MTKSTPNMVERHEAETALNGQSYEEANWAKLSPAFRAAHNRLRQLRGMPPIPPPKIDLYKPPAVRRASPEELAALGREQGAEAKKFLGGTLMGGGPEGFTINGKKERF